jgi:hypothetical protein
MSTPYEHGYSSMEDMSDSKTMHEQMAKMAEAGDLHGIKLTIDVALEHPDSELASQLEAVAVRVDAHTFFDTTKHAISHLQEQVPVIDTSEDASKDLANYENVVKDYLNAHTKTWHDLVGLVDEEPNEKLKQVLERFRNGFNNRNSPMSYFAKKALKEMGVVQLPAQGVRSSLASASEDVTEIIWGVVQEGRDVMASIAVGASVSSLSDAYGNEVNSLYMKATEIATSFAQNMANPEEDKKE